MAERLGARVVREQSPGYGAAVHAGVVAARHDWLAVMDGDGSFDPDDLLPLLDEVTSGRADLALGRRRPVSARRVALARAGRQHRAAVVAAPQDRSAGARHRARCA